MLRMLALPRAGSPQAFFSDGCVRMSVPALEQIGAGAGQPLLVRTAHPHPPPPDSGNPRQPQQQEGDAVHHRFWLCAAQVFDRGLLVRETAAATPSGSSATPGDVLEVLEVDPATELEPPLAEALLRAAGANPRASLESTPVSPLGPVPATVFPLPSSAALVRTDALEVVLRLVRAPRPDRFRPPSAKTLARQLCQQFVCRGAYLRVPLVCSLDAPLQLGGTPGDDPVYDFPVAPATLVEGVVDEADGSLDCFLYQVVRINCATRGPPGSFLVAKVSGVTRIRESSPQEAFGEADQAQEEQVVMQPQHHQHQQQQRLCQQQSPVSPVADPNSERGFEHAQNEGEQPQDALSNQSSSPAAVAETDRLEARVDLRHPGVREVLDLLGLNQPAVRHQFRRLGLKPPAGLLLHGVSGVGKTWSVRRAVELANNRGGYVDGAHNNDRGDGGVGEEYRVRLLEVDAMDILVGPRKSPVPSLHAKTVQQAQGQFHARTQGHGHAQGQRVDAGELRSLNAGEASYRIAFQPHKYSSHAGIVGAAADNPQEHESAAEGDGDETQEGSAVAVGDAEERLRALFRQAADSSLHATTSAVPDVSGAESREPRHPAAQIVCVLINGIELLCPKRTLSSSAADSRLVATLLTQLDGARPLASSSSSSSSGGPGSSNQPVSVVVVGTTAHPDALDPALRRPGRLDRELRLTGPPEHARRDLLLKLCRRAITGSPAGVSRASTRLRLEPGLSLSAVARSCVGYLPNDLRLLVSLAVHHAFREADGVAAGGFGDLDHEESVWANPQRSEQHQVSAANHGGVSAAAVSAVSVFVAGSAAVADQGGEADLLSNSNGNSNSYINNDDNNNESKNDNMTVVTLGSRHFEAALDELVAGSYRRENMGWLKEETVQAPAPGTTVTTTTTATPTVTPTGATAAGEGVVGQSQAASFDSASASCVSSSLSPSLAASTSSQHPQQQSQHQQPVTPQISLSASPTHSPALPAEGMGAAMLGGDELGGMEAVQQRLLRAVVWPALFPERFLRLGVTPPRGILLYGPPGCGKTSVVRAMARALARITAGQASGNAGVVADQGNGQGERGLSFSQQQGQQAVVVGENPNAEAGMGDGLGDGLAGLVEDPEDDAGGKGLPRCSFFTLAGGAALYSAQVGESERRVRELFQMARANLPAVIFLDEIDCLAGNRGSLGAGDSLPDPDQAEQDDSIGDGDAGGDVDGTGDEQRPGESAPSSSSPRDSDGKNSNSGGGGGGGGGAAPTSVEARVLSTLLNELDGLQRYRTADSAWGRFQKQQQLQDQGLQHHQVKGHEEDENEADLELSSRLLLVASTNRPDSLDSALIRPGRFDECVYVPPPDARGRLAILRIHTRRLPLDPDVALDTIAERTPLYTGADLENLCREAVLQRLRRAVREARRSAVKGGSGGHKRRADGFLLQDAPDKVYPVTMQDFEAALAQVGPSLDRETVRRYERMAKHGFFG